jgi:hypothetical protein
VQYGRREYKCSQKQLVKVQIHPHQIIFMQKKGRNVEVFVEKLGAKDS